MRPAQHRTTHPARLLWPLSLALVLTLALVVGSGDATATQQEGGSVVGRVLGVEGNTAWIQVGDSRVRFTLSRAVSRGRLRPGTTVRLWYVPVEGAGGEMLVATRALVERAVTPRVVDPSATRPATGLGPGGLPSTGTLNARGELVGSMITGDVVSVSPSGIVLDTSTGEVNFSLGPETQMPPGLSAGDRVSVWYQPGSRGGMVAQRVFPASDEGDPSPGDTSRGREGANRAREGADRAQETAREPDAGTIDLRVNERPEQGAEAAPGDERGSRSTAAAAARSTPPTDTDADVDDGAPARVAGTVIALSANRIVVRTPTGDITFLLPSAVALERVPGPGARVVVWYDRRPRGFDRLALQVEVVGGS